MRPRGQPTQRLSPREVQVLKHLIAGKTQADIDRLYGAKTARIHIARVKDKYLLSHMPVDVLIINLRRILFTPEDDL